MIFLLPENLDLKSHLQKYPPSDFGIKNFNEDNIKYIISLIYHIPIRNREINEKIKNGFVPLHSGFLQSYIREYNKYLDYLIETGILVTDGSYVLGKKCRGYKLKEHFYFYQAEVTTITDAILKEKVRKNRLLRKNKDRDKSVKELKRTERKKLSEYKHLTKWLGSECKLMIDKHKAIEFIEKEYEKNKANPEKKIVKGKEKIKNPEEQKQHAICNVLLIAEKDFYCLIDDTVQRLHSPLTNMKGRLRNYIKYGEETLVSIDIKNSQPYLSNIILKEEFWTKGKSEPRAYNHIKYNKITNKTNINKHQTPLILAKVNQYTDNEDVIIYRRLISDGSLYDYLMEKVNENTINKGRKYKSRKEVKSDIFRMFFSGNGDKTKLKSLFKEIFHSIHEIFYLLKQEDKSALAILLQRIESHLVLKVITKKISKSYPEIPLFTIHDSIVTTEQHCEIVKQIMKEELEKHVGLPPTLAVEPWRVDEI